MMMMMVVMGLPLKGHNPDDDDEDDDGGDGVTPTGPQPRANKRVGIHPAPRGLGDAVARACGIYPAPIRGRVR